ncbi:MAG: MFS transporter [Thermomicrobiaceae bacterium]
MNSHEASQTEEQQSSQPDQAEIDSAADDSREAEYNSRGTWITSGAHFAHDLYPAFIGVLIPAIQSKLAIPLALASLMVPAQQMPSVLQPFIGYLADRTSKHWFVVLSPGVAAISLSMIGLAPHIAIVLMLLFIAGVASAAFHAPSAALAGEYGGPRMGRAMAIFLAGGELARTIGPLIITAAIALFTLEGSFVVVVFGLTASVLLYFTLDTEQSDADARDSEHQSIRPLVRARLKPLIGLFGYSIIKAFETVPYQFFLVTLLVSKGYSEWYAGVALSILFGAGVVGGFIGGSISDRIGRKTTLVGASLISTPIFLLYLTLENGTWWVLGLLIFIGIILMSVRTIGMAQAQELLPEARGPIAGMMLASSSVSLSLGSIAFGALSDWLSIQTAFTIAACLPLAALPFIALLPAEENKLTQPES